MNAPRIGYVLKVFPRLSQTFILREVLAHQRAGAELVLFSLRPANDSLVHEELTALRAPLIEIGKPGREALVARWRGEGGDPTVLERWCTAHASYTAEELDAALAIACEVRRKAIDVLHAHFAKLPATIAQLASRLTGVPFCFTAHARDIFHASIDRDALRQKLEHAAAVVTVSDHNRRHLLDLAPRAAIHTIYNGIEPSRLSYRDPTARRRGALGVGRLVAKKGFADLLEAVVLLRADVRCRLIGDGPLAGELHALRERLNLAERVSLEGARTQHEVVEALMQAAVFAAPCTVADDGDRDGLPTVLIEAMALGTPCVSTPVTGIAELVRDGDTGLLVPERAPSQLAAAMNRLLDDPQLARRLSQRARERIEREFDVDRNAARMRSLWTSVTSAVR